MRERQPAHQTNPDHQGPGWEESAHFTEMNEPFPLADTQPDTQPDQVDYRGSPSFGGDVAQEPITRDDPNCSPAVATSPGPDHEIAAYDLPDEPHTYNQMALGIAATEQGWSSDTYRRQNPDTNPRR